MACCTVAGLIVLTYPQFTGAWFAPYMCIWLMGVLVSAIDKPFVRSSVISGLIFAGWVMGYKAGYQKRV
jgi:hypothetical protein